MLYQDYRSITFEQIELMKRTIRFDGTRLHGWRYKSFHIRKNDYTTDQENRQLRVLCSIGIMERFEGNHYCLTTDGIQVLSYVTEVDILE